MRTPNKYGKAAIRAVKLYGPVADSPQQAWDQATCDLFGSASSGQEKGCPKGAFLGLCEDGLVSGFSKGRYTRAHKNKEYALRAVAILWKHHELADDRDGLWRAVMKGEVKQHNSQMDVVVALWKSRLLK